MPNAKKTPPLFSTLGLFESAIVFDCCQSAASILRFKRQRELGNEQQYSTSSHKHSETGIFPSCVPVSSVPFVCFVSFQKVTSRRTDGRCHCLGGSAGKKAKKSLKECCELQCLPPNKGVHAFSCCYCVGFYWMRVKRAFRASPDTLPIAVCRPVGVGGEPTPGGNETKPTAL